MKWFEGEIPSAIAESRRKNGVFVVVIFQKQGPVQPESMKMEAYWDKVNGENFDYPIVAVKVFDGTSTKNHFSQLYSVPVIPSAYFIDPSGRTLDIITLSNSPDQAAFSTRLENVMKKMGTLYNTSSTKQTEQAISGARANDNSLPIETAASSSNAESLSASTIQAKVEKLPVFIESDGRTTETGTNNQCLETEPSATLECKIKRAQELLLRKHTKEEDKRREEEIRRETERRDLGKLMAKVKANRNELEIRALAEQRRRDKLENEKQLKRLREQIKADREEKLRREGRILQSVTTSTQPEICCNRFSSKKTLQTECRIQVKFPNGDTLPLSFQPTDAFLLLVNKIKMDGRLGQDFILTQNYPRRTFDASDYECSFTDLGLTPSATILVFSNRKSHIRSDALSFPFSKILYYIIIPFQTLLRYVLSFVWFGQNTPRIIGRGDENKKRIDDRRQVGNIHRFRNQEDSSHESDDEARWNGNSTQQL